MNMNIIPMRNRNSSSNSAPNNIQNCLSKIDKQNASKKTKTLKFIEISRLCHLKSLIKLLFHPLDSFRSAPTSIGTFTWLK